MTNCSVVCPSKPKQNVKRPYKTRSYTYLSNGNVQVSVVLLCGNFRRNCAEIKQVQSRRCISENSEEIMNVRRTRVMITEVTKTVTSQRLHIRHQCMFPDSPGVFSESPEFTKVKSPDISQVISVIVIQLLRCHEQMHLLWYFILHISKFLPFFVYSFFTFPVSNFAVFIIR